MRHIVALIGVFVVAVIAYTRIAEPPFLRPYEATELPAVTSDETEPEDDAEALCAVLAHLGETMSHTFHGGGGRMEFSSIEGHSLFGFIVLMRDQNGHERMMTYAHQAVVRVVPDSRQVTLEVWSGPGFGPTGPSDFQIVLPLSEFVPGL